MPHYRFFQTNAAGQIVDGHLAECLDDDEAIAAAPEYLPNYAAVEICLDRRRIARVTPTGSSRHPAQHSGVSA